MKISLIGMSGVGKTHWSRKLEKVGFKRFSCDEIIGAKLNRHLRRHIKVRGTQDVSNWMGQPYDKRYKKRSQMYLKLEQESMEEILNDVEKMDTDTDVVIDTTGSGIYTLKSILDKLAKLTKIAYLETPPFVQKKMYKLYLTDPKPVIWGTKFQKKRGESNLDALARCYPKLLLFRTKAYKRLAHITIDYTPIRQPNFSTKQFIQLLTNE